MEKNNKNFEEMSFNYIQKDNIRVIKIDEEPWFCLRDVCNALNIQNSSQLGQRIMEDNLTYMEYMSGGQNRNMLFTNEKGLYRVIFHSNKKEARKFQDWVFDEVLPAIRKTGKYEDVENKFEQTCPISARDIFQTNAKKFIKNHGGRKSAPYIWYTWYREFENEKGLQFYNIAKSKDVRPIDWLKMNDLVDEFYQFVNNKFM